MPVARAFPTVSLGLSLASEAQRRAEQNRKNIPERRAADKARREADYRINLVYASRKRAKRDDREHTIAAEDIEHVTNCPVCGVLLERAKGKGNRNDHSPTLDRFDPAIGYLPGNVFVICWRCNDIKGRGTMEDHLAIYTWMRSVSEGL